MYVYIKSLCFFPYFFRNEKCFVTYYKLVTN